MGSYRAGSSAVAAGPLDAGGVEDEEEEEEEVTADSLRCRRRPLPLSALSAFSYVPPRRLDPKEHSYYDRRGQVGGGYVGGYYQRKRKDSWLHHHQVSSWRHIRQKDSADLSDSEHTTSRKQTQIRGRSWLTSTHSSEYAKSPQKRARDSDHIISSEIPADKTGIISLYDCVFKKNPGYNQKLHRDDREHAKSLGLYVNAEEQERPVGVLTSSVYGKHIHQPVEPLNRDYSRANNLKTDFYRKNGIPSFKAPGFGHISPA